MTTTNTEAGAVADVAAKLTEAQREVTAMRGEIMGMPFAALVIRPLIRRGIFSRHDRKGFQTRWHLTPLGLAVRQHLEQGATAGVAEMNEQMFGQGDKS